LFCSALLRVHLWPGMENEGRREAGKSDGGVSPMAPLLLLTACAGLVVWLNIVSSRPTGPAPPPVFRKTIYQEDENGCGPAALAMVLTDHGIVAAPGEIAAGRLKGGDGMSMLELKSYAESRGLAVAGWRLTYEDLRSAPKPAILLVSGGHFLVVDSIDGLGRALCRDPQAGNKLYPREVMAAMWQGEALVFTATQK